MNRTPATQSSTLKRVWHALNDFLFPPTRYERRLRTLTGDALTVYVKPRTLRYPSLTCAALFDYRDPTISALIQTIKYRGDERFLEIIGIIAADVLLEFSEDSTLRRISAPLVVIPVPLSNARLKARGYNQSERLAHALSRHLALPHTLQIDTLVRVRDTIPQTNLSRQKRHANIHGAFVVHHQNNIVDRDVVLLDDVVTTGATLCEAARVLKNANARSVRALTIAH